MLKLPRRRLMLAAISVSFFAVLPASAQTFYEDIKLIGDDTAGGNLFGVSVAISGNTIIIGAPGNSQSRGAAYLFDRETGQQLFKLTALDRAPYDSFGRSVAISGTTAIVGAPQDNARSGSVYMFDTETGLQIRKLTAADRSSGARFGSSLAISGTTAIIGATSALNPGGIYYAGSVYLFDLETGLQTAQFFPSNPETYLYFGSAVAISDTTAIIGASSFQSGTGAAYLFDRETGLQTALFIGTQGFPDSKVPGEGLGQSVAISGTTAIVGSHRFYNSVSHRQSGTVYLYDTQTGLQTGQLFPSDQSNDMSFGQSVMVSGTTIIVGASRHNGRTGATYLFDFETGLQTAKLVSSDGAPIHEFGHSVTMSGSTAIIGASNNDDRGNQTGSAYIFDFAPKIQHQPLGLIVSDGDTAEFSVTLADETGTDFLWRRNGIDLLDGGNISGTLSSTLQVIASEDDEAYYDCVVTNRYGPTLTHPVVLGIMPDPNACEADLNGDGTLNFFDVQQFIVNFSRGCP